MTSDVFSRFAALDPAADPERYPDWDALGDSLLATIDGRTTTVSTELESRPSQDRTRTRRNAAWAVVGAFAIVVIAGLATLLVTMPDDGGVAAGPTPPFESADEAAEALVSAMNGTNAAAVHALLAPDYTGFGMAVGPSIEETEERIRFDRAIGMSGELGDCVDVSASSVECDLTLTLPPIGLLTGDEIRHNLLTVRLNDFGEISSTSSLAANPDPPPYDLNPEFATWLDNAGLTWLDLDPYADSTGQLAVAPEDAAERMMTLIQQFLDERNG